MEKLLKESVNLERQKSISPILILLQEEQLKKRGCGSSDYNYIDYYRINGDYYGFIDEIIITPEGGYIGEDDWEKEFLDSLGNNPADEMYNGTGSYGSGSSDNFGNQPNNNQLVDAGRDFVDSLQNGDVNIQLTSEILDFMSTTISITGLVNTVAECLTEKVDTGMLGKIGSWLGGVNTAYSGVSAIIGLTDGEQSPRDCINGAAFIFSVGSYFVPALGFVSVILTVAACAAPGDQTNNSEREY